MKPPISVVISAYNEEKKVVDCLKSVDWADEVIVIDNSSTDRTAELAKKNGAKVFARENNLMLNVNKNFGFSKARNEWILSLDADERVTSELAEEIDTILNSPHPSPLPQERGYDIAPSPSREKVGMRGIAVNGYLIPRKNIIFGKWIQHTGWYPDYQLRLFKKSAGRFPEKHVHEMISLNGEAEYLQQQMVHYNFETIAQFLHKTIVIYTPNEASELLRNGYKFNYLDAIRFPMQEFLRRFFTQEGYKDGFHGLMLSLLMACYHLMIFAHLWEMHGFKDPENSNILHDVEKEMKTNSKEFVYWLSTEKLKQATDPLKKTYLKIKRKINSL